MFFKIIIQTVKFKNKVIYKLIKCDNDNDIMTIIIV